MTTHAQFRLSRSEAAPPPVLRLSNISRIFVAQEALQDRIARLLGAGEAPRAVRALDDVTLEIHKGEVVGLVGESGCGKSTLGRIAAGILAPSGGRIEFEGRDVASLRGADARRATLAVQMVFQDPASSLNPRQRVGGIIAEGAHVHRIVPTDKLDAYVDQLMTQVGLNPATKRRYPHQFSGGQRQRIGIARALAVRPEVLICDEAVSALDVSVQAQVLNLFQDLREQLDLTSLFISHDLGVIEHVSNRVVVMYLGRIVEEAPTAALFAGPLHPYTNALLAERPSLEPTRRVYASVRGEIPSPLAPPPGCHFHPRCPQAGPRCAREAPALRTVADGRRAACHLHDGGTA